jgi:hypothetical protein
MQSGGSVVTQTEEKLIEVGNALARSIGHAAYVRGCPKGSPAVPCTCGAAQKQAQALGDWEHLTQQIKES